MLPRAHRSAFVKTLVAFAVTVAGLCCIPSLRADTGGHLEGTVLDVTGAVIQGASLRLIEMERHATLRAVSNAQGRFVFPNVAVGRYELTATAPGFVTSHTRGLLVDLDSALRLSITLKPGSETDITVSGALSGVDVESMATSLGNVVSSAQMTALPLNGRSYTDLLSLQAGVAPMSTLLPGSVIMAGVTGTIDPSGDQNPGNLSINGQRESANGFLVNGIDVQEHMNGGTSVLPNLDSIEEFRVLTDNFDAEYGNYNGGIISVVTKAAANALHGSAFEFFRNTQLDARGFFDTTRPAFDQNQFGGTLGAPVRRDTFFLFADYQGTRTTQGISTGRISVPSLAQRAGTFTDLTGRVGGPYLASLLTQKLGYSVTAGEPYSAVFPSGTIPYAAWSNPGKDLLPYIPAPNAGVSQFSSAASSQTVRDDKGSARVDANTRLGRISAYYFIDDYRLDNPYPSSVAGATIPGFDALFAGRAQLAALGATTILNPRTVNELHFGLLRNANIVGQPKGNLGVPLTAQGLVTSSAGAPTPGIFIQAPQFEGVENITFPSFTMGVPITNLSQFNNTLFFSDGLSRVFGNHTLKAGGQFHADQVNTISNATFNGTFSINGTETGDPYADLLLGVASNFTQSSGARFYLRNRYAALYVQDSWRARHDLTVNAGLRWDLISPWREKYNQLQTYIPGARSVLYPGAPVGLVVAGDPGVPATLAPADDRNFAPRIGAAYAPSSARETVLGKLFGSSGDTSLRASFGLFYTAYPGLSAGVMYAVPPFGYNYLSPGPPLIATPFLTAATGQDNRQRFPFALPPHNVSAQHPDLNVDWANLLPVSADPFFSSRNRPAYIDSYLLSFERRLPEHLLLTVSYVGNQGHRILGLISVNPGNSALCLSLAPACGPFGEDSTYVLSNGEVLQGTRQGQGPGYDENTTDASVANSNYNALQTSLHFEHERSQFLLSYTYSKSIDQGSNLGEQLDPFSSRQTRALSAWDMTHDFVASYALALPVATRNRWTSRLTTGSSLSGVTRFATGLPVTLTDTSDNSLLGTLGNGANNYLLDTPRRLPGPLHIHHDGRTGMAAFNTTLFPVELEGQLGNAKRRSFYGPGIENFDAALRKSVLLAQDRSLDLRLEAFNVFNHAQFYGPAAVNGQEGDPNFGHIQAAAAARLLQMAVKFSF